MTKAASKPAPRSVEDEKPALRVERVEFSEAVKEAIRINLRIAKNASQNNEG